MTPKLVVQKQCERCPRVEQHEVSVSAVRNQGFSLDPNVKTVQLVIDGEPFVSFGFLCDTCREIVNNYALAIGQKLDKISSRRKRKKKPKDDIDIEVEPEEEDDE